MSSEAKSRFPLWKLTSIFKKESDDEILADENKTVKDISVKLGILNGQVEETLEYLVSKEVQKRLHKLDKGDLLPDDMEENLAFMTTKLAMSIMKGLVKDTFGYAHKTREQDDTKNKEYIARLERLVFRLGWMILLMGLITTFTVLWAMYPGFIGLELPFL